MSTNQTRTQLAKIIDDGSSPEAADLTASVILAENVVIKRADLPEVVEDGGDLHVDGTLMVAYLTATQRRQIALRNIALAEHLDAKEAREAKAAKEAELTKRRDALATELCRKAYEDGPEALVYDSLSPISKLAINWLMEAQDKLAKYEEVQA